MCNFLNIKAFKYHQICLEVKYMKFKNIIFLTIGVLCSQISISQEGLPIYTDYLTDNYYLIHPSMAGVANCSKVRLTARQQWFGHEDAPKLLTLSINGRIGETQSALGGILYTDKNGYHSQTGAYVTYAHHLMFSRSESDLNMLSFGLNIGAIQYKLAEMTIKNFTAESSSFRISDLIAKKIAELKAIQQFGSNYSDEGTICSIENGVFDLAAIGEIYVQK